MDEAINVLEQMKSYGCTPDLVHYNCVLDALAKVEELSMCQSLYDRMLIEGLLPSVITHTIMIVAL
ncbi:hypothetical protein P5E98_14690, partial [Clostridium perfringens]|nr:hypothetical protein [Clostridium perfringens]